MPLSNLYYADKQAGASHEALNRPCQDAFAFCMDGNIRAAALCDGLSGAKHSDVGAELISCYTAQYFRNNIHFDSIWDCPERYIFRYVFSYRSGLLRYMSQELKKRGLPDFQDSSLPKEERNDCLRSYASTVQAVAIRENQLIYFRIGNGSTLLSSQSGGVDLVAPNTIIQMGQPTPHVAYPLHVEVAISADWQRVELTEDVSGLLMATDGADFALFDSQNHVSSRGCEAFSRIQNHPETISEILAELHDDPSEQNHKDDVSFLYLPLKDVPPPAKLHFEPLFTRPQEHQIMNSPVR